MFIFFFFFGNVPGRVRTAHRKPCRARKEQVAVRDSKRRPKRLDLRALSSHLCSSRVWKRLRRTRSCQSITRPAAASLFLTARTRQTWRCACALWLCVCLCVYVCLRGDWGWRAREFLSTHRLKRTKHMHNKNMHPQPSDLEADRLGCSMINTTLMAAVRPQKSMRATWAALASSAGTMLCVPLRTQEGKGKQGYGNACAPVPLRRTRTPTPWLPVLLSWSR